jgi:hypothetical protein
MHSDNDILINALYLDTGLIPPGSSANEKEGDRIRECLASVDPRTARIFKRRFRKYFRKAVKWHSSVLLQLHMNADHLRCSRSRRRARAHREIDIFKMQMGITLSPGERIAYSHLAARRGLVKRYLSYLSSGAVGNDKQGERW